MKNSQDFSLKETHALREMIREHTGYYFKNTDLLKQAFTRSSYSAERGGENNEILELIGDSVLSYYVLKIIVERNCRIKNDLMHSFDGSCQFGFQGTESEFSSLKNQLVCNSHLAGKVDEWGLTDYLIVGKSDFCNHVDQQEKVKADLFEAILGAVAVAVRYDSEILQGTVCQMLDVDQAMAEFSHTKYRPKNYSAESAVSTLKELAEHRECSIPQYEFQQNMKTNFNQNKGDETLCWACTCMVQSWGLQKSVFAKTKKDAKKYAAYLVLCQHYELTNEYIATGDNRVWYPVWMFDGKQLLKY